MDRFDAMQAFVRVVETGSFTRAAASLHMSKTTATQLVQRLEARLRVKLLNRTTRKVSVTTEGAVYYERVRRLLADLDDTETSVSGASAAVRGRLRVDVASPLACMILIPALPSFYASFPGIQLDLGVSDRRVDLIDESVDCVLRVGELIDPSLVTRQLGMLPFGIYAASEYLSGVGAPAHPAELALAPHRLIGFRGARHGKVTSLAMQRGAEQIDIRGHYALTVDDGNACLAAGLAGLGVVCLPRYVAEPHVRQAALVALFEDWTLEAMPVLVAYAPNRYISAKMRAFIDWVTGLLAAPSSTVDRCRT
mgnify:FL=1